MSYEAPLPEELPESEAEGLDSPLSSLECPERCEEPEESLSMFCLDDLEPLCQQCAAVNHAGHRVYLLTEAADDCKEELRTSLTEMKKKVIDFKKVPQTYKHTSKYNQAQAKVTEEHMKKEFEQLHQFLRQEEAARLLALKEEKEEKTLGLEQRMDKMSRVIKSLDERIQLIEEELEAGGDGVEFLQHYQNEMNSIDQKKPEIVCRPLIDVAKHLGNLQYDVWNKMEHVAPYIPVTLDPRTAGQSVRLSAGLNSVHISPGPSKALKRYMGEAVAVPANPERFHPYSCILAREGFNAGVHWWDVEVGGCDNWTLGVAAESVSRRAEFEACPEAGLWCISLRDGKYQALTTPSKAIPLAHHLNRVHVRLNWDGGLLEFTNPDTNAHLFTFKHCFAETVYPYFESISAGGSLALLTQRVNISVGSDCVPVEDIAIVREDEGEGMKNESTAEKEMITNGKVDTGHLTEENKSVVCSVRQEKTTKTTKKENKSKNKTAVKKQSSKSRFNVSYHVSLNKALNSINNEHASHKQT
ncbi:nuclear factor 7, brain-like [Stegastes partitus]|uniref:Nuclear factor 7, brain-like n=1 Tax=Stegastes partitus TaxID=144197 RepID=A0A3B4ZRR7_9TELE|nr:PREDICTED: nuclear factor 7, brain-like [Stegastes partitus]